MKIKTLEKLMTFTEAKDYVFKHPKYRLPTKEEADEMDNWFPHWIDTEPVEMENALVAKTNLLDTNILFKNKVVLIGVPITINIPITKEFIENLREVLILGKDYEIVIDEQKYKFTAEYKE